MSEQAGLTKHTAVLFVCMGNICRSPTAEAVFRALAAAEAPELRLRIDSAGTHGYHVGDPPDPRTQAAARRRGIDMSGLRARRLTRNDFDEFDQVLVMDEQNRGDALRIAPRTPRASLRLFLEYAPQLGRLEVPDPYYGGETGFEDVLDLVEEASRGLLDALRRAR
ncbi:MAG: low molecular weight phosphotyrosine protein phosphatase [Proteobacteria bacterium]|nr:low molecular weight phosphotyrosine protein phosphatase [Pseudomonadota bacterium]